MTTCNGLCLTGTDVGVPAAEIAYIHPDCELHNGAETKGNTMPIYRVHLRQTVGCVVAVEAEDEEVAIEYALQAAPTSLCAACSGWGERWSMILSGEWETDWLPGEAGLSAVERIS